MIPAIIWDLDGTLLDTLLDLTISVNYALTHNNLPTRTIHEVRQFVGNGVRQLMLRAMPLQLQPSHHDTQLFQRVFADFQQHYVAHCHDNTGLYPGIADTLSQLHQNGVRMAIVSNKLQPAVTQLVNTPLHTVNLNDNILLQHYMTASIGESKEVPKKPAPDMLLNAITQLGITPSQAVYVGDSEVDIITARNAGIPCISVLWGFRDREFLIQHGATTFAQSPHDILHIISSQ